MDERSNPGVSSLRRRANAVRDQIVRYTVVVAEEPDNIANIGAIIRNANALGIPRVYLISGRRTLLPYEWRAVRQHTALKNLSASASKWTFMRRFENTEACLEHLARFNFFSVVTSPHQKGKENAILHEHDYTQYGKLAIWFGNESRGISDRAVEAASACIQIPMSGIVESLNLGCASGIVLYEVARQRRAYQTQHRERLRLKHSSNQ